MQVASPTLPEQLLEFVPLPLLLLRDDGTVERANPRAIDRLGCSLFAALDRPLAELVARLDPPPAIERGPLPGAGQLVALVDAPAAPDERAAAALDRLEQRLHRAADALPPGVGLARRELLAALDAMRGCRLIEEDRRLERMFEAGVIPAAREVDVDELLRGVLVSLAPWVRLSGAELVLEQSGDPLIEASQGHVGRLVEELLLFALRGAQPGGRITIERTSDGRSMELRLSAAARPDTPGLELARKLAALHGGELIAGGDSVVVRLPVHAEQA